MSKYKLINKTTGTETICDKVTIDGFDYYVSDEKPKRKSICISKTNAVYQNNQQSLNDKLVFLDKEVVNIHEIIGRVEFGEDSVNLPFDISELKKVIATNNPNIDVPKVVDEVEEITKDERYSNSFRIGFKHGYNKSQETHPFSDEDMIEFSEWLDRNTYVFDGSPTLSKNGKSIGIAKDKLYCRVDYTLSDNNCGYTTKELLQLWKEQRPKIVYYG